MEATLYKQSGEAIKVYPNNGTDFTLEELQGYVDGYIEIVVLNEDLIIVINEEGKLDKNARLNERATAIARKHNAIYSNDYIVGNAILCARTMVK